jgi:hypothetical protein
MGEEAENNPNGDYMQLCDDVFALMCEDCPNLPRCMPTDDDDTLQINHEQMCVCMQNLIDRINGRYPEPDDVSIDPECQATGQCEDVAHTLEDLMCADCTMHGFGKPCMPLKDDIWNEDDPVNYRQMCECLKAFTLRAGGIYPNCLRYPWKTLGV